MGGGAAAACGRLLAAAWAAAAAATSTTSLQWRMLIDRLPSLPARGTISQSPGWREWTPGARTAACQCQGPPRRVGSPDPSGGTTVTVRSGVNQELALNDFVVPVESRKVFDFPPVWRRTSRLTGSLKNDWAPAIQITPPTGRRLRRHIDAPAPCTGAVLLLPRRQTHQDGDDGDDGDEASDAPVDGAAYTGYVDECEHGEGAQSEDVRAALRAQWWQSCHCCSHRGNISLPRETERQRGA